MLSTQSIQKEKAKRGEGGKVTTTTTPDKTPTTTTRKAQPKSKPTPYLVQRYLLESLLRYNKGSKGGEVKKEVVKSQCLTVKKRVKQRTKVHDNNNNKFEK